MKKLSKILCSVLVLALLCTSLAFVISASEEEAPAPTEPFSFELTTQGADVIAAMIYGADDNRLSSVTLSTNTVDGWSKPGARQAEIITDNETGNVYYHEYADGRFNLKPGSTDGNEYANFSFNPVALRYEKGYNEYIIVEYDMAFKSVSGTYTVSSKEIDSWSLRQQIIARGSETSFGSTQYFSEFGFGGGFSHITTVYDYTTANAYIFVNGELVKTYANGALSSSVHQKYMNGESFTTSEWRVGSNSYDDYHIDNAYIRYAKMPSSSDSLGKATSSGQLSAWEGNIYNDDYVMPNHYWFIESVSHSVSKLSNVSSLLGTAVAGGVEGNLFDQSSFGNPQDILSVANSVTSDRNYLTFFANSNGSVKGVNSYYEIRASKSPRLSVAPGCSGYYVVDFDIASHADMLPYLDISVMLRRASDDGGFPFSANVEVASYISDPSKWTHVTIVGDMAANQVYLYINGEYAANPGYAYNAGQLNSNTALTPKGIRVDFTLTGNEHIFKEGQNITFDNFSERIYTTSDLSGGLPEAVEAGDLTRWKNYTPGNTGKSLPPFISINGVEYSCVTGIDKVLSTNDDLDIEFLATSFLPVTLNASAVINTNGMDISKLVKLHPDCKIVSTEGNIVKTWAKFKENIQIEDIAISGQSKDTELYNNIKYKVDHNLFTDVYHHSAAKDDKVWGTPGHRKATYITNLDTGDVMYRETSILNSDGKMNTGTNEYVNLNFTTVNLQLTEGQNEYIVADFDFGTDSVIDDRIAVQLIPRYKPNGQSAGAWANDVCFKDMPIVPGTISHVTVVFDFSTNDAHVFVNGRYVYSVDDGAMDDVYGGNNGKKIWTDEYLNGTPFTVSELKITSDQKTSTVCLDNVAIRSFKYASDSDELLAAVKSRDITTWSESIYDYSYKCPTLPAVAEADGVKYGSIEALNKALESETDGVKNVEILHTPDATIKVKNDTVVETNDLAVSFDWATGLYEFTHDDPLYVSTETGVAYASNRLVLVHNAGDSVYTFASINQENCMKYATPVQWCYDQNFDKVDVVFYVFGDQITAPDCPPYVKDGKMYVSEWCKTSTEGEIGESVENYPVASAECGELWYMLNVIVTEIDYTATDLKYGATVNSGVDLTLYVNKEQTVTEGETVVIDGKEYVAIVTHIAPHEIDKPVTVEFEVMDIEGKLHVQRQQLCFVDYAKTLLEDEASSDSLKKLLVSLLNYANEAHALFNDGATMESVDALLEVYGEYDLSSEVADAVDVTSLRSVIRSAAMKLNGKSEFVFKVARGFKGLVTFRYEGVSGEVVVIKGVDTTFREQVVVLDGIDVRDVCAEFTITFTEYGTGDLVATGSYSLATYIHGLESIGVTNTDFAKALAAYSKAAIEYTSSDVKLDVMQ